MLTDHFAHSLRTLVRRIFSPDGCENAFFNEYKKYKKPVCVRKNTSGVLPWKWGKLTEL